MAQWGGACEWVRKATLARTGRQTTKLYMEITTTAEKAPPRKHRMRASKYERRAALATRMFARADTHMLT